MLIKQILIDLHGKSPGKTCLVFIFARQSMPVIIWFLRSGLIIVYKWDLNSNFWVPKCAFKKIHQNPAWEKTRHEWVKEKRFFWVLRIEGKFLKLLFFRESWNIRFFMNLINKSILRLTVFWSVSSRMAWLCVTRVRSFPLT